jgi:hypothetical protein
LHHDQGTRPVKTGGSSAALSCLVLRGASIEPTERAGGHDITFEFINFSNPIAIITKDVQLAQTVNKSGIQGRVYDFGFFGLDFEESYVWCNFKSRVASERTIASSGLTFDFEAHDSFPLDQPIALRDGQHYVAVKTVLGDKIVWVLGNLAKDGRKTTIHVRTLPTPNQYLTHCSFYTTWLVNRYEHSTLEFGSYFY